MSEINALGILAIILQSLVWLRRSRALAGHGSLDREWRIPSELPAHLAFRLAGPVGPVIASGAVGFYDPRTRTIGLPSAVVRQPSLAALAVAVHEIGHAIQQRDVPWLVELSPRLRSLAVAAMAAGAACVAAGSFLAPVIASAGLLCCQVSLFGGLGLVLLERDASRRGLRRLVGTLALADEVSGEDLSLVRAILDAAALTYLAAPFEGLALLGKVFASG